MDFPNKKEATESTTKEIKDAGMRTIIDGIKQDIEERKKYAEWIFCLVCIWLFIVLAIVCGIGKKTLILSDGVIITLISSTTANVAAYFYVVTKYLFPHNEKTKS